MKLMNYKEAIAMGKEKLKELQAIPRAFEMKKLAEYEQSKIDAKLSVLEQQLNELAVQYPVPFDAMLAKIDEIELLQRRKTKFTQIIAEMFGDVEQAPARA